MTVEGKVEDAAGDAGVVIQGRAKTLRDFIVSLKPQIQMLMLPASIDSDVGTYANMIMDQMDALQAGGRLPVDVNAKAVFSEPGLIDLILEVYPQAGPYRVWLERLRLSVLDLLSEGESETENAGKPG